ncbi:MAG: metallopeptidase family protein [Bifidobacterium tibiigranuli]|nr:metallopeptidase family protein [Bifidobacterium tibiigranuli]MCI1673784.1 metallopeptidase family protein [Bifidobacterium tibiigranuli]MCI1712033.1 metallopeptidase family protein [Bifidobacterium tibiigranuli]MCI1835015.1 metallopeptidase family protein [Bifidobacterium tibiigranuli]
MPPPRPIVDVMSRVPWQTHVYRNRHGRGVRTPMFGVRLPQYRTKSGLFDDIVASQIRRLSSAWPQLVKPVQFAVEDVPPVQDDVWQDTSSTTSRSFPAQHGVPARIVLYRMALQMQVTTRMELQWAIRDELVSRIAELYGRRPEEIDPDWGM